MSTIDFVTADFPPTFIGGGNGDGLTWLQGVPMSQRLRQEGVDVTTLFWPAEHTPALQHEYQFHLDLPEDVADAFTDEPLCVVERHDDAYEGGLLFHRCLLFG